MDVEWTEWTPETPDLPELDAETLAAVRALQGGETEASTRHLFATFKPQLVAYFRRHGCQDIEADDHTQSVFIQMLEQIASLKDPASFHFWLFKIAGNTLRNHLRDSARDSEGLEEFAARARKDSESGTFWMRGTFEPSPEARLAVSETVDRRRLVLSRLLEVTRLKPQTRRSLMLRLRGDSHEEIARALEIPVGTVWSHISRASAALARNLEKLDLSALAAGDAVADSGDAGVAEEVAELSAELLTYKREALEADPAYFKAGILEAGSADYEAAEESEEAPVQIADDEDSGDEEAGEVARVMDSPAALAAVVRQDRRRGRRRRRPTRTIPPAGHRDAEPDLGRLERDDLGFPLILLEEAAARCGDLGGSAGGADGRLALKAKLTCAGALLARGRRFRVARRAEEAVRLAILLIGNGRYDPSRGDDVRHQVAEGRRELRSFLGRNPGPV